MGFLYFPEDGVEYLPAIIVLLLFSIAAIIITRMFFRISKKEEEKFNQQYGDRINLDPDQGKSKK
ncbi:hypothetical protein GH754_02510 [Salinibacillus xinjiangensis]|uniref:Uncharacterized protein n=2 Tax=Salinibacillus xinjiangensis TaxID=1229268 RepID=A0A6G1X2H3_9BACI|nr:hypothetical protein [Salinibacillus xinjiangensis]